MAGRPKKLAEKVEALEFTALVLAYDTFSTRPEMDLEQADSSNPICVAWKNAVASALWASIHLDELGDLLRNRAGINEPGPFERISAEMAVEVAETEQGSR